jgi:ERCC4-type nuclease
VDTREQAPWPFQGITIGGRQWVVRRQVETLKTADYSIVGFEDRIVIERKSPEDLLGTITAGNARFRAEHERMQAIVEVGGFACVIVEGCLTAICNSLDDPCSGRRVSSETVLGITAAWPQRFGVHWFYAGDRRRAELLAFKVLYKWWSENATEGNKDGNQVTS